MKSYPFCQLLEHEAEPRLFTPESELVIGIDPAFRKGGFWVCAASFGFGVAVFFSYRDVLCFDRDLQKARSGLEGKPIRWAVENSNLQNFNFAAHSSNHLGIQARLGRNVGANQAASAYAVQAVQDIGFAGSLVEIKPETKGHKMNHDIFLVLCRQDGIKDFQGYTRNQDQRDAYSLCSFAHRMAWKRKLKI